MKKVFRITAYLIASGVFLAALAAAAVRVFLPPAKAKALLQKELTARLGRDVELGDVQVGLIRGVEVAGFKLSEKPSFDQGTFVSSDRFLVRIAWTPLLARKIIVREIALEGPQVNVVRRADGKTYNFSDLVPAEAAPAKKEEAKTPAFEVTVLKASLADGRLAFVDQSPARQSMTIEDLNLRTGGVRLNAPISFEAGGRLEAKGEKASVKASGNIYKITSDHPELTANVSLDLTGFGVDVPGLFVKKRNVPLTLSSDVAAGKEDLDIRRLRIALAGIEAEITGKVTQYADEKRRLDLEIKTNAVPAADLSVYFPKAAPPADVSLSGTMQLNARVSGPADRLSYTAALDGTGLAVGYADSFKKPAGTALLINAKGITTDALITAEPLSMKLDKAEFQGSLTMTSGGKSPGTRFRLKSAGFPLESLARMSPPANDHQPAGPATLNVEGFVPDRGANDLTGTFTLKDGSAKYEAVLFSALTTTVHFTMDSVDIASFSGKLDGAPLKLTAKAAGLGKKMTVSVDLDAAELDLEKIMPSDSKAALPQKTDAGFLIGLAHAAASPASPGFFDKPFSASGRASIGTLSHAMVSAQNVELKWNLNEVAADLSKLNGTASLRTGSGEIKKVKEQARSSAFGKILLAPLNVLKKLGKVGGAALKIPSFDEVKFRSVAGDYTFQNGVMNVAAFRLSSPDLMVEMTGTAGLAGSQPLNLKVPIRLGGESSQTILHLKVAGSLTDPNVGLDAAATGKQAVDILKSGTADKLLKSIGLPALGGGSQPPKESGSSQTQPEEPHGQTPEQKQASPQDQIQDLLKGLLKKKR